MNGCALRIGEGYDVHRFAENRPLIVGGVTIPYAQGLAGHSDADVLLHAVSDALLGAAALGDIGQHFPDTDPAFLNADSQVLLRKTACLVKEAGYQVVNLDATIIAQAPKMMPYLLQMRQNIADCIGIPLAAVSVKATTEEHLGFTGRKEGIASRCVCLLSAQA